MARRVAEGFDPGTRRAWLGSPAVCPKLRIDCSSAGVWRLTRRHGWSLQWLAQRALERDEHAVELWNRDEAGFSMTLPRTRPGVDVATSPWCGCAAGTGAAGRSPPRCYKQGEASRMMYRPRRHSEHKGAGRKGTARPARQQPAPDFPSPSSRRHPDAEAVRCRIDDECEFNSINDLAFHHSVLVRLPGPPAACPLCSSPVWTRSWRQPACLPCLPDSEPASSSANAARRSAIALLDHLNRIFRTGDAAS